MDRFNEYIAAEGRGVALPLEELDSLLSGREWFSLARVVREHSAGHRNPLVGMLASFRGISSLKRMEIDASKFSGPAGKSADEVIDRFLAGGNYRIVAEQDSECADDENVRIEAEFSDEDDLVSEDLAEVYLSQGLREEALRIYRKLSLRNTEKSVYFAEIIDRIENNN
ncbi:MAG: hypothetical protein J1E04_04220 [Alistipes sp.]|nr:hypothetical protein [Alistipes sp.]